MYNRELDWENLSLNNVYLIENRNYWDLLKTKVTPADDSLIFCIDFGLKKELQNKGYKVVYLDHFLDSNWLEKYNYEMHEFLASWYKDHQGNNILSFKGYNIGDALLLNVLHDVTYFCHFFFNFYAIKNLKPKNVFIAASDQIKDILKKTGMDFQVVEGETVDGYPAYQFPIGKWMEENTQRLSLKSKFKDTVAKGFDYMFEFIDFVRKRKEKEVYIQYYYSTAPVINMLKDSKDIGIISGNYSGLKNIFHERRIFFKRYKKSDQEARGLLLKFTDASKFTWSFDTIVISDHLYDLITPILTGILPKAIDKIKSIESYLSKRNVRLMVPISNLWLENRLIMQHCFNKNIPVFLIINGMLSLLFWSDARDSTYVNCYGESIKETYFKGSENALPLGDPRMDGYAKCDKKQIDRTCPSIVIGTSGFNLIDLNSYLAVEFDFFYDVLKTFEQLKQNGKKFKLTLKARANNYTQLYSKFIQEYFPDMEVTILQHEPFQEVIKSADLYISFYSQTHLEAASIGVPSIYYKNDTQHLLPPFDIGGELVIATNQNDLLNKILLFYDNDSAFDLFMKKETIEKYVGPLDGYNTTRNVDFITSLV